MRLLLGTLLARRMREIARLIPAGPLRAFAAVEDLEVVAVVGGEEDCDVAESFGECWGGKQRVLAFAEVVIVEIEGQGKHVDGQGVREGGLLIIFAGAFVGGHGGALSVRDGIKGTTASFPGVLAGFAANSSQGLRPGEGGEAFGDADGIDEVVSHVDQEFEGQPKTVIDQPGGEKDTLVRANGHIAVADGAIAEVEGVNRRGDGLFTFHDDQRDEVVAALDQRWCQCAGDGSDEAL